MVDTVKNGTSDISKMLSTFEPETLERLVRQAMREQEADDKKKAEEEKKSAFTNFAQFNLNELEGIQRMISEKPVALKILLFIIKEMDGYNNLVCSYKVLQELTGRGRTTVSNAVKYLKEHNFVAVYKAGTTNVYSANSNLVWKSWGKNQKYARCTGAIVLSLSEQDQAFQKELSIDKPKTASIKEGEQGK